MTRGSELFLSLQAASHQSPNSNMHPRSRSSFFNEYMGHLVWPFTMLPISLGPGVKASGCQQTGPRGAHAVENIQTSFRACAFDFWGLSWYEQALDTALHGPHWPFLVMASTAYYLLACLFWVGRSDQKGQFGENEEQEDNSPSIPNAIMNYLG